MIRDPTHTKGMDPTCVSHAGGMDPTCVSHAGGMDPTDAGGMDPTDAGGVDPTDAGGMDPTSIKAESHLNLVKVIKPTGAKRAFNRLARV